MRRASRWILLAGVLALAATAHAGTVVLSKADVGYVGSPEPPYEGRYLVRFGLPELLSRCTVELAILELRAPVTCPEGTGGVAVDVFPLTGEWDAATVDWSEGWSTPGGDFDMSLHGGWEARPGEHSLMRFDVTDMVVAWASGKLENMGLLVTAEPGDPGVIGPSTLRGDEAEIPTLRVYYTGREARDP
jgi:hypothetical protein